jgi:archaellum component FlaF (FlaF/FlaG flagellin family)
MGLYPLNMLVGGGFQMGFSLSAAAAIVGVSILIAMGVIFSAIFPTFNSEINTLQNKKDRLIEQKQTSIDITDTDWDNPNTVISVDNIGSLPINTSNCNILRNGISKEFTCSVPFLYPEKTALFYVEEHFQNNDIIKIITPSGIFDYYEI